MARAEAELIAARRARRRRTIVRTVIGAAVVLALLFAWSALQGDDDDGDTETADTTAPSSSTTTAPDYSNPELAQQVIDRGAPDPAPPPEDTPRDALEVSTLIEGEGEGAAEGDQVVAHYVGKVPDGAVFDSSWDREPVEPLPVPLGQGQVIAGWDEGLVGAKIGERRRLVIGSDKAYGEEGTGEGGPIGPNTPLAFEVDIVDIQRGAGEAPAGGAPTG